MNWRRVGVVLFVLSALTLIAGVLSNLISYGEMLNGERDITSALWDFDGRYSEQSYAAWDWSFFPGLFNAAGLALAALGAVLFFGAKHSS